MLCIGAALSLTGCNNKNMSQSSSYEKITEETTVSREIKFRGRKVTVENIMILDEKETKAQTQTETSKYQELDINKIMNAKVIPIEDDNEYQKQYIK